MIRWRDRADLGPRSDGPALAAGTWRPSAIGCPGAGRLALAVALGFARGGRLGGRLVAFGRLAGALGLFGAVRLGRDGSSPRSAATRPLSDGDCCPVGPAGVDVPPAAGTDRIRSVVLIGRLFIRRSLHKSRRGSEQTVCHWFGRSPSLLHKRLLVIGLRHVQNRGMPLGQSVED